MKREEDVAQDLVDGVVAMHQEHMISFGDDMGGMGTAEGEDFVAGAVEVKKGLREDLVLPFEDGVQGPVNEAVVPVADDPAHEAAVTAWEEAVFSERRYLNEAGGDEPA